MATAKKPDGEQEYRTLSGIPLKASYGPEDLKARDWSYEKQLGDALLITIAPRLIGGTRIAKSAAVLPESAHFDYTQVDRDMLVWGRL